MDAIVLKGPAIAQWLYETAEREYGDVDLLVDPGRLRDVARILRSEGYRRRVDLEPEPVSRVDRATYAFSWHRPDGVLVEVHQTLVGVNAHPRVAWDVLSRTRVELDLAGRRVSILGTAARAMHLALHAAQHGSTVEKPLEDLRRGLAKERLDVWHNAYELAVELEAVEAFTNGLALVREGEEMLGRLGVVNEPSLDVALHSAHSRSSARAIEWFRRLPPRDRFLWLAHKIVPTPRFMRLWHPLARWNWAGLVLAYLWRPIWVAKELVLGLVDRERVRREMRPSSGDGP